MIMVMEQKIQLSLMLVWIGDVSGYMMICILESML